MTKFRILAAIITAVVLPLVDAVSSQAYTWKNVKIGGGGGFIPGIVFNPSQKVCFKPLDFRVKNSTDLIF